ncbi:MAG TPA: aminotransferase class I/II-fold pyridoxal phosphate-dependent enzyme [Firmicutes bacterium]|nr:aminotransferase class I/II-fold pyridoxal phosphate-dependent enzyme [Bacillota bacterium]
MKIREFLVERWLNTLELGARFNLAETDAKPFTLEELLALGDREELLAELAAIRLGYNPTMGSFALRQAIAGLYQSVTPEQVLVTGGAIEADFLLANVLVEPGDTVIVQFPAYQVLYAVAEARGATVKRWTMSLDNGYRPDLDRLAALIDDRTKLVVINTPHNPTGAVLTREELETILGWAEERGFWVLSDEVYHGLAYEEGLLPPLARDLSPRAISVGSMSKTFGLSGLRLGWIAGPEEILQACWSWKDYTSISNSPLSDFLARLALVNVDRVWERNLALARENRRVLLDWFEENRPIIDYVAPRAGLVCFPRFNLPISTEEFCRRAYEERGVLLVPGECFEMPGHIRFGFGGDPAEFAAGLRELGEVLREVTAG